MLRHNYENIAAPIIWKLAQADLAALQKTCRDELDAGEWRALHMRNQYSGFDLLASDAMILTGGHPSVRDVCRLHRSHEAPAPIDQQRIGQRLAEDARPFRR